MQEKEHWEPLSKNISVFVSQTHHFSTDTLLLAQFSLPKKGERCADFGTGCGTIPLWWCARGKPGHIFAVEIQPDAAGMAAKSVEKNDLFQKISVLGMDFRNLKAYARSHQELQNLDLIVCNPPYKQKNTGIQNAAEGLRIARHEETCTLQELSQAVSAVLRVGGKFCLCQRPERLCDVLEQMRVAKIEPKRLRFVQQRMEKAPKLFLLEGVKGGKPGLSIEPVLLIEGQNGYSQEMIEIYGDYREAGR